MFGWQYCLRGRLSFAYPRRDGGYGPFVHQWNGLPSPLSVVACVEPIFGEMHAKDAACDAKKGRRGAIVMDTGHYAAYAALRDLACRSKPSVTAGDSLSSCVGLSE